MLKHYEKGKAFLEAIKILESKECMFPGCTLKRINSHILQKKGILDKIAVLSHVWEYSRLDFFQEDYQSFKRLGLNQAFSFPCFCEKHDGEIFKEIEQNNIDALSYKQLLLFNIRTILNEIYRKEVLGIFYEELLKLEPNNINLKHSLKGNNLGITDTKYYEDKMWEDIMTNSENFIFNFCFKEQKEIVLSSIFSHETTENYIKNNGLERFSDILINYFPYKDKCLLILGYLKEDERKIKPYVNMIMSFNQKKFETQLTNLLLFRCENWVCSDSIYKQIHSCMNLINKIPDFVGSTINERKIYKVNMFNNKFCSELKTYIQK